LLLHAPADTYLGAVSEFSRYHRIPQEEYFLVHIGTATPSWDARKTAEKNEDQYFVASTAVNEDPRDFTHPVPHLLLHELPGEVDDAGDEWWRVYDVDLFEPLRVGLLGYVEGLLEGRGRVVRHVAQRHVLHVVDEDVS